MISIYDDDDFDDVNDYYTDYAGADGTTTSS